MLFDGVKQLQDIAHRMGIADAIGKPTGSRIHGAWKTFDAKVLQKIHGSRFVTSSSLCNEFRSVSPMTNDTWVFGSLLILLRLPSMS